MQVVFAWNCPSVSPDAVRSRDAFNQPRSQLVYTRIFLSFLLAASVSACGGETPASSDTTSPTPASSSPAAAAQPSAPSSSASDGSGLEGIVLRYAPGGRPDAFCAPQWSIANQTATDVPGMLIQIAWHGAEGEVLQDVGEFGTLQENLSAGRQFDRTLEGYLVACDKLKIVVATYACRDDNAVRMTCPAPLHVLTEGGIQADVSALREGPMRGAMEP